MWRRRTRSASPFVGAGLCRADSRRGIACDDRSGFAHLPATVHFFETCRPSVPLLRNDTGGVLSGRRAFCGGARVESASASGPFRGFSFLDLVPAHRFPTASRTFGQNQPSADIRSPRGPFASPCELALSSRRIRPRLAGTVGIFSVAETRARRLDARLRFSKTNPQTES